MKPLYRLTFSSLLLAFFLNASAQDVKIEISSTDLVNLNNKIGQLRDSNNNLNRIIKEKDSLIITKSASYANLLSQNKSLQSSVDSLKAENHNKDVKITEFKNDVKLHSAKFVNFTNQMQELQEIADRNAAKLANGRLYFKYSADLVQSSIQSLLYLKTEQVKKDFKQALDLLQRYKDYSVDVKQTLMALQSIDRNEWKSKHPAEEYKNKCISILKQSSYYRNVYSKRNGGAWSIPYLDNLIDVTKAIISKHNPVHSDLANFTPLIEML